MTTADPGPISTAAPTSTAVDQVDLVPDIVHPPENPAELDLGQLFDYYFNQAPSDLLLLIRPTAFITTNGTVMHDDKCSCESGSLNEQKECICKLEGLDDSD